MVWPCLCISFDQHHVAKKAQRKGAEDKNESMFYSMMPPEHIDLYFIGYWMSSIHMVIVTYFYRGSLLSPNRLLVSIISKGFLYALSHRQDSTNQSLWWTSCWPLVAQTAKASTVQDGSAVQRDRRQGRERKRLKTTAGNGQAWRFGKPQRAVYPSSNICFKHLLTCDIMYWRKFYY